MSSNYLSQCFTKVATINSMTYNQLQDYTKAWNMFRAVESYNSNISTQRGQGNKTLNYYQFTSQDDASSYRTGTNLFFTYLGISTTVQKN
jgi:hypothetical protein